MSATELFPITALLYCDCLLMIRKKSQGLVKVNISRKLVPTSICREAKVVGVIIWGYRDLKSVFFQFPDLGLYLHFSIMLISVSFFSSSCFVVNSISSLSLMAIWGSSHQQWVLILSWVHKSIHSLLPFLIHPFIYPSICLSFYSTNISCTSSWVPGLVYKVQQWIRYGHTIPEPIFYWKIWDLCINPLVQGRMR